MTTAEDILAEWPDFYAITEEEYPEFQKRFIADFPLPSFYTFKPRKPLYTVNVIKNDDDSFTLEISAPDGSLVENAPQNIVDAHNHIRNNLGGLVQLSGDHALLPMKGEPGLFPAYLDTEGRYISLFIEDKEDMDVFLAKGRYHKFLESTLRYEKNPDNFRTAWNWLDRHPAFWSHRSEDDFYWSTENNSRIWMGVSANREGNTVIMLEHGAAVRDSRTHHYHDLRLDIYAPTYEEAIIQLAAKVYQFFEVDGSERKDVEYEKSELEITLEEKVAAIDLDQLAEELGYDKQ
jgi:hypothetical protein